MLPVPLLEIAVDGYMWNLHAEHLGQHGQLRLRHTDVDNPPHGREVHWNSAFAWYLRALGEAHRAVTGDALRNSISRMSVWANPLLLCVFLAGAALLTARRFGLLAGGVLACGMLVHPPFFEAFMAANPDHHGIAATRSAAAAIP